MSSLLREVIRNILVEAAMTTANASGAGLALLRANDGHGRNTYILYMPSVLENMITSGDIKYDEIAKGIVGYISVQPHQGGCWNAGEVKLSAAQKGYGPLMYQIAMTDFAGGLFPDRGSTSQAARAVWQKYVQRGDVEKKPFDDIKKPKTPDPADDCPLASGTSLDDETAFLNQAYDAPGDASGRSNLMAAHTQFIASMEAKGFKKNVVETMIENVGDEYFSMRYRDG